jgi:multidrug efflux system membrane fusion protein
VPANKGTPVARGDVLCALQRGAHDAALAQANAQLAQARLDHDATTQLAEAGTATKQVLAGNKATLDAAEAVVKKAEVELGRTRISAPFAGIVEEQPAKAGELLNVGSVCAVLIAPDPIFIVGAVTEREVGRLKQGMYGTAQLATGEKISGAIRFVGTAAEQSTRTFRVELEVANPDGTLRDGVTATMRIPLKGEAAHRLPPSALTLNDAGQLGVRVIERGDLAQFRPVKVLSDERGAVWVGGLPRDITVIVAGQDFVTDGQRVGLVDRRAAPRP